MEEQTFSQAGPASGNHGSGRVWLVRLALATLIAVPAFAQAGGSPWENAVDVLRTSFTGPIARGLSLIAIVVCGLANYAVADRAVFKTLG